MYKLSTTDKSLSVKIESTYKPLSSAAKILDINKGDKTEEAYLVIVQDNEEVLKNKKIRLFYYPDINNKKV